MGQIRGTLVNKNDFSLYRLVWSFLQNKFSEPFKKTYQKPTKLWVLTHFAVSVQPPPLTTLPWRLGLGTIELGRSACKDLQAMAPSKKSKEGKNPKCRSISANIYISPQNPHEKTTHNFKSSYTNTLPLSLSYLSFPNHPEILRTLVIFEWENQLESF